MQPFFRSYLAISLVLVLLLFTGACSSPPAPTAAPSPTPLPSRAIETPPATPILVAFPTLPQTDPTAPLATLTLSASPAPGSHVPSGLPVVQMVSPMTNTQISVKQTLNVVAFAASDNAISHIELSDDSVLVEAKAAPGPLTTFSTVFDWTPTRVGAHILRLIAYDANNVPSAPQEVTITVTPDSRRPTANILYPLGIPQLESGTVLQVYAVGTDEVGVTQLDLWADGKLYTYVTPPNATTPSSFSNVFTWNAPGPGNHTLVVRTHDTQDQTTDSAALKVFVVDTHIPALSVAFGQTNTLVGQPISITITALDISGIQRVELWTGKEISDTFTSTNPALQTQMSVQVPWQQGSPGDYSLLARAYNADGNYEQSSPQTISVLRADQASPTPRPTSAPTATRTPHPQPTARLQLPPPPNVQLTQPTDKFSSVAPVHISFSALGNAELARVEVWGYSMGLPVPQVVCSVDSRATTQKIGTCDWSPNTAGAVSLFAQAVDIYDQMGQSTVISGTILAPSLPTPTPTPVSMGGGWTAATSAGEYDVNFRPIVTASGTALRGEFKWTTAMTPTMEIIGRVASGTVKGTHITFRIEFTPAPTRVPTPTATVGLETPSPTAAPSETPAPSPTASPPAIEFDCNVNATGGTLECSYKDARGQSGTAAFERETSP